MNNKKWVGIGPSFPRLELLVAPAELEDGEVASPQAKSIHGLRIGVVRDTQDPDAPGYFNRIQLREIALEQPIWLDPTEDFIIGLRKGSSQLPPPVSTEAGSEEPNTQREEPTEQSEQSGKEEQAPEPVPPVITELTFEGLEGATDKLLGLVSVWGWKLKLKQEAGPIDYQLVLQVNWELDSLPSYFPGFTKGEAVVSSIGDQLAIEMAWPFSVTGKLYLHTPHWTGTRWRAYLDFSTIGNVLDSAGDALNSSSFGLINVSALVDKMEEAGDVIDDYLYLVAGTDDEENDFFSLEISTPDAVELAEFAGMQLWLLGRAAFEMRFTFVEKYIDLEFFIRLGSEVPAPDGASTQTITGIELRGPIIRKIESLLSFAREAATLLPIEGVTDLPEVKFRYTFDFFDDYKELELGKLQIPTTWEDPPVSLPALNFLKELPMEIPPEALDSLENVKLGSLDGTSPSVKLDITRATSRNIEGVIELNLKVDLGFKIFDEIIEMKCDWTMAMDLEALAFDIGRQIRVDVQTNEIEFGGLKIVGLQSIEAEWGAGGIVLKAEDLKAYFVGLSEDGDTSSGFELVVSNLLIDSGGLDLEAHMIGGTSKLNGIGDHFKGASGAISIKRSEVEFAELAATGPLPWMDNATGSLKIVFGRGFRLTDVKAEFQLGLHTKTDWWIELGLERVNIDLDFSGPKPALLLKVTGSILFKPPPDSAATFLSYFEKLEVEFTDLVLTKSFDRLPPGIKLKIDLSQPKRVELFGVFGFEVRSIGIGSGFEAGEAALDLGGQVFFSAGDSVNTEADFHGLRIGAPARGEFLPRISLEQLDVHVTIKSTLELFGSVSLIDTDDYKGFKGMGKLIINKSIAVNVIMEFARVRRESDNQMVRMWMVFAELEGIDTEIVNGFYLRDIGLGFGWRKTLRIMDQPLLLLSGDSSGEKIAPHHPESWVNDLEGEEANWTVVFSSWLTYGVGGRNETSPLVGDIIIAFRSDLTFLASIRGWLFGKLNQLKQNSLMMKPAIKGMLYYSARNKHLIAAFIVDPTASAPEGVPPAIVQALIRQPFSFVFETRPGLLRIEFGWPRQLSFPLGLYTGNAGIIFRKATGAVTIGVGFEIAIDKRLSFGIDFGIAALSVEIIIYIGVFGIIMLRIGNRAALWGMVGINALILINLHLRVGFVIDLGFWEINISFTISFGIVLTLSAGVSFGISDAGFGMAGYATVGLRIWKFSFAASVSFSINQPALDEAYRRVFEGTSGLGDNELIKKTIPLIPKKTVPMPEVLLETPAWRIFYLRKEIEGQQLIYLMAIPLEDVWFSNPEIASYEEDEMPTDVYAIQSAFDYQLKIDISNLSLLTEGPGINSSRQNGLLTLEKTIDWNQPMTEKDESGKEVPLGHLFYESVHVKEELRVIDRAIELNLPELLKDKRVRSDINERVEFDAGLRSDVRSPKFEKDTLYDTVMETAFANEKGTDLSWEEVAVAHTDWCERIVNNDALMKMLFGAKHEEIPREKPEDAIEADHWKKSLLEKIKILKSSRSSIVSQMLEQFRSIALGVEANLELLERAGVFFAFNVEDDTKPITLDVQSLTSFETIRENQKVFKTVTEGLKNAVLDPKESGLGFAQNEFDYRIKDVLEFQDEEGLYFSWILECRDSENNIYDMTEVESSGVSQDVVENDPFEFFDHYRIERINLSRNEDEDVVTSKEVKPAYAPALQDMGAGLMKFFLVVPRFEYVDLLNEPKDPEVKAIEKGGTVEIGDELLYRVMAVDVFGNRSQVTEIITERKRFTPPPVPANIRATYDIELIADGQPKETLDFTIQEADEVGQWEGAITYEIWTRSKTLFPGSFLGYGDVVAEHQDNEGESLLTTEGLRLVASTNTLNQSIDEHIIKQLSYGEAHTFYVRAVSEEGNASRLVVAQVNYKIGRAGGAEVKQLELPYLERIPNWSKETVGWVHAEDIRYEIMRTEFPVFSGSLGSPIIYQEDLDPTKRQLLMRFPHLRHIDQEGRYLVGGYEVYARNRDTTIADDFKYYEKLANLDVVPEYVLRNEPNQTNVMEQWSVNLLTPNQQTLVEYIVEKDLEFYQDWGEEFPALKPIENESFLPEGSQIHVRLYELLQLLTETFGALEFEMTLTGGLPTQSSMEQVSFAMMQEKFNSDADITGSAMLKWLGRSVDFTLMKGQDSVNLKELADQINIVFRGDDHWSRYHPVLEMILAGDQSTPMYMFRLSLWPVISTYEKHEDNPDYEHQTATHFTQIVGKYVTAANEGVLSGMVGKEKEILALLDVYPCHLPVQQTSPLQIGVSYLKDQGQLLRSVRKDGTLLIRFDYTFDYARRFAYKIKKLSRYHFIYSLLGFPKVEAQTEPNPVLVRFPRVKLPRPPAIQFLGNRLRGSSLFSEWLIPEHEEETKVRNNETARNQLGYRSVAWSLFAEVKPGLMPGSGWVGETNWYNLTNSKYPLLTPEERSMMENAPHWESDEPMAYEDGLLGHPFEELLGPKGMVVRIPNLPYYYGYRMGAFVRTDDVDSVVKLSDEVRAEPALMPVIAEEDCGWYYTEANRMMIWWKVPSVWESLDKLEKSIWRHEAPFAQRLWDFDIQYNIILSKNLTRITQIRVRPESVSADQSSEDLIERRFEVQATGNKLFFETYGSVEPPRSVILPSPFEPYIKIEVQVDPALFETIRREDFFAYELECSRLYGRNRVSNTKIFYRTNDESA
ncbi:hypothetical protein [Reichenbachiella sp.]|uniref:hypothetical protein n=1 Tax=Reichenbachiella sp. TaxID=2184521 RepID=UPI003BAE5859